jgi:hypothetical protein
MEYAKTPDKSGVFRFQREIGARKQSERRGKNLPIDEGFRANIWANL